MAKKKQGEFFAVDKKQWDYAARLGMFPAIAYLMLARGSQRDNKSSSWSVQSIEKRGGVGRERAKKALGELIAHRLVVLKKAGTRPLYEIVHPKKADLIWLPNTLITGAGKEVPPIQRLRQTGDSEVLRLLIDLYGSHHLLDDGGIKVSVIRSNYHRVKAGERHEFNVWAFAPDSLTCWSSEPEVKRHWKSSDGENFWERWKVLETLGLVESIPHILESDAPDAQPAFPVGTVVSSGAPVEKKLGMTALQLGRQMVTQAQFERAFEVLCTEHNFDGSPHDILFVPVLKHMISAQLADVYRLRYRPRTNLTSAWWAEMHRKCEGYLAAYQRVAEKLGIELESMEAAA